MPHNEAPVPGVLLLDKPAGITSQGAVNRVRALYGTKQVGHTGTLDPMATGVLVVLVGRAVKVSEFVTASSKRYLAEITLGVVSDTEDIWGKTEETGVPIPTEEAFRACAASFLGKSEQIPPMVSALKVGGKKLCDLARQGVTVEREPREIEITSLTVERTSDPRVYRLDVACSKGTYIRTLCADIGKKLGCGAVMSSLRRTENAGFPIGKAVTLDALGAMTGEERNAVLLPVSSLFDSLPEAPLTPFFERLARSGCEIYLKKIGLKLEEGTLVRLTGKNGLFALGEVRAYPEGPAIKPVRQLELPQANPSADDERKNKTMTNVLVLAALEPADREKLALAYPDAVFSYGTPAEPGEEALARAGIIIGQPTPESIAKAKNLRWIQFSMSGVDSYMKPGVIPENVQVTNVTGAFGLAISEHMVACTMMLMKKLHLYGRNMINHDWIDRGTVESPENAVVLVLGMGDIGGNYAKRMKALGSHIIGMRRADAEKPDYCDELFLYSPETLDSLLPRADIVALSMPGTKETYKMFDARRLSLMKKGSMLLNVGRGNAVDCAALADALKNGPLGTASVDVTDPEPLPKDHPLWDCENCLVTPHISGFYHLRRTYEQIVDVFAENLRRYRAGEPLIRQVDRATGYGRKDPK